MKARKTLWTHNQWLFSSLWASAEAVYWQEYFARKVYPKRGSSSSVDVKEEEDSILQSYDINSSEETSAGGDVGSPCGISGTLARHTKVKHILVLLEGLSSCLMCTVAYEYCVRCDKVL